jgi:hypothetical protein
MGNLRGHVFDDGRFAGNIGLGARRAFYDEKMLFGANVFYDVRQYHKTVFNQVGGGIELLMKGVDIRFNGYLPVGKKQSFDQKRFLAFSGSEILIKQKIRGTLPSVELDFGVPMGRYFYLGFGPYYLFKNNTHGTHLGNRTGVKGRLEVTIDNILVLGGTVSYDPIFKTRAQGYISINIPLGKRPESATPGRDLWNVPLVRNEIIPIQKKKRTRPLSSDSSGDNALHVVFVNNQTPGPGDGTFAAPFSSLKAAEENSKPGDIIYVFPGDGTPRNMDEGIVLKPDQLLASSGSPLEIADVIIPPATPDSHPVITNVHPDQPIITNPGLSRLDDFYIFDSWSSFYNYFDEPAAVPAPQDSVVLGDVMTDDHADLTPPVGPVPAEDADVAAFLASIPVVESPDISAGGSGLSSPIEPFDRDSTLDSGVASAAPGESLPPVTDSFYQAIVEAAAADPSLLLHAPTEPVAPDSASGGPDADYDMLAEYDVHSVSSDDTAGGDAAPMQPTYDDMTWYDILMGDPISPAGDDFVDATGDDAGAPAEAAAPPPPPPASNSSWFSGWWS